MLADELLVLIRQNPFAEDLVRVGRCIDPLHSVHQIGSPAVVELDAIPAATVPTDRWRSRIVRAQETCAGIVNSISIPNFGDEYISRNLAVTAAVKVGNAVADHKYLPIQAEISAEMQSAFNEQYAVTGVVSAQR